MSNCGQKILDKILEYCILFSFGGMTYMIMELLFRGRTHYIMAFCGGFCFVAVGLLNEFIPWNMSLILQSIIGGFLIITPIELIFGLIFNMDYSIWDYRTLRFNFLGQISLNFTILWCLITTIAIIVDDYLRYRIFNEEKPNYKI